MVDPRQSEIVGKGVCIIPKVVYIVSSTKFKYLINLILALVICLIFSIKLVPLYSSIFEKLILLFLIFTIILLFSYHSFEYLLYRKSIAILDPSGNVYKGIWAFVNFLFWSIPLILFLYDLFKK